MSIPASLFNQHVRERIGPAIYLLAWLHAYGEITTTTHHISQDTGFPEKTIIRWIARLRKQGLIVTHRLGGTILIRHAIAGVELPMNDKIARRL